jgi:hypothetical protein
MQQQIDDTSLEWQMPNENDDAKDDSLAKTKEFPMHQSSSTLISEQSNQTDIQLQAIANSSKNKNSFHKQLAIVKIWQQIDYCSAIYCLSDNSKTI